MTKSLQENLKPVSSSEEAIEQLVGKQFTEWLLEYVKQQVNAWTVLQAYVSLVPKTAKLKKYFLQKFLAAEAFWGGREEGDPGLIGFAVANLSEASDPLAEGPLSILEEQQRLLSEGLGEGKRYKLWLMLLKALGINEEEIKKAEPREVVRNYIAEISDLYSSSDWLTAVGAFCAHEAIIYFESPVFLSMLRRLTLLSDQDLELFKNPAPYPQYLVNILEKLVVDQESKGLIFDGISRQLAAFKELYEALNKYLIK